MAFFKFRKAGAEQAAPAPAPESVEAMRKRARYRLLGAAMLVLAGVVGFPLVFDNQPRPIAVDLPIEIPDKTKVRPLVASGTGAADAHQADASAPRASSSEPSVAAASAVVAAAPASDAAAAADKAPSNTANKAPEKEEVVLATSKPAAKAEAKPTPKAEAKPATKPEAKADSKTDTKTEHKADASGRFVVQFGAFTDANRAHEARMKVEKTGLKTYAQIAEGPEGKKYRVRVGPFDKRSEAEKAAEKIKKLDLPVSILGL